LNIARNGGFVWMSTGTMTPATGYWNGVASVSRMWIRGFWSIETPGIRASPSERAVFSPSGRAAMSCGVIV
jgi:hypothetical protein